MNAHTTNLVGKRVVYLSPHKKGTAKKRRSFGVVTGYVTEVDPDLGASTWVQLSSGDLIRLDNVKSVIGG